MAAVRSRSSCRNSRDLGVDPADSRTTWQLLDGIIEDFLHAACGTHWAKHERRRTGLQQCDGPLLCAGSDCLIMPDRCPGQPTALRLACSGVVALFHPIGEERYKARLGRARPRVQRRGASGPRCRSPSTNSRMSRLTWTGLRACGRGLTRPVRPAWPAPPERGPGAGHVGTDDGVLSALDDQARAPDAADQRSNVGACVEDGTPPRVDQGGRRRFAPPSDGVLDLHGRVRLGEDLREEEFQEPGAVASPVGGVVLGHLHLPGPGMDN